MDTAEDQKSILELADRLKAFLNQDETAKDLRFAFVATAAVLCAIGRGCDLKVEELVDQIRAQYRGAPSSFVHLSRGTTTLCEIGTESALGKRLECHALEEGDHVDKVVEGFSGEPCPMCLEMVARIDTLHGKNFGPDGQRLQ